MDNGANLTLGLVAVLAAAGAVRRRGSRSDDEWLEAVPVGYSEKPEIARLVKQGSIEEAHRLNESVFGVYGLGRYLQLQGANFKGADLYMAVLHKADLEGANLRGANLRKAMLAEANLQGADLRGAHLEGANLWRADLERAKLTNIYYDATTTWPSGFTPPRSSRTR